MIVLLVISVGLLEYACLGFPPRFDSRRKETNWLSGEESDTKSSSLHPMYFTHSRTYESADSLTNRTGGCRYIGQGRESMICEKCNIGDIHPGMIPGNLTYLQIREVNLVHLSDIPVTNSSIRILSVTNTFLQEIRSNDFEHLPLLADLDLSNNIIAVKNSNKFSFFHIFQMLERLATLDLSHNNIRLVDVDQYQKDENILPNLAVVDLSHNPLMRLEENLFFTIRGSRLQKLVLENCSLDHIHPRSFVHLIHLEELELRDNPALLQLNLHESPLSAALYYIGSKNFSYLGLSSNSLSNIPFMALIAAGQQLRRLDLSDNKYFTNFGKLLPFLRNLKELKVRKSQIITLSNELFNLTANLETVDLSYNWLKAVPNAVRNSNIKNLDISSQLCLEGQCVPSIFNASSLRDLDKLHSLKAQDLLFNLDGATLSGTRNLEYLDISSVLLRTIAEDSFQDIQNLTSLICSQCWLLEPIPMGAWNDLKNLQFLNLSYSPSSVLPPLEKRSDQLTFVGLENIKVLDLTCALVRDEKICTTPTYEYESPLDPKLLLPMVQLEELYLSKNGLTSWDQRRFVNNVKLRKLDLSLNRLRSISSAMMEDFRELEYLNLMSAEDHRISCDAQVVIFYNWGMARSNATYIEGWNNGTSYMCDDTQNTRVVSFQEYAISHFLSTIEEPKHYITEGIIAGACISLVSFLVCIIYSYRQRFYISFWIMRAKRKYRPAVLDKPPPYYDVFISYSDQEDEWVTDHLLAELEQKAPRLNACFHQRDFKIGVSVIENIVSCMENSRKILLVLSNGFLNSRWCVFESYVAQHLMKNNMDDIVIIMAEKLTVQPDKTISFILKTRTYLEYTETKEFWRRVKYSVRRPKTGTIHANTENQIEHTQDQDQHPLDQDQDQDQHLPNPDDDIQKSDGDLRNISFLESNSKLSASKAINPSLDSENVRYRKVSLLDVPDIAPESFS